MPEIVTDGDARYAYELVCKICAEVDPGLPGTSQEWARAAIIKEELESHLGVGQVVAEEFTLAPGAFISAYPFSGLFMLLAAGLNIVTPHLVGVLPWLIGLIVMLATSLIQLAGVIASYPALVRFGTLGVVLLAYPILPAIIIPLFFTHGWKKGGIVPGAAGNLSASALAWPCADSWCRTPPSFRMTRKSDLSPSAAKKPA